VEERGWVQSFVNAMGLEGVEIPNRVALFKRALFRTEIHSALYTAVRKRTSYHVAVCFEINGAQVTYYAKVLKFFKITLADTDYRLALISSYPNTNPTNFGTTKIVNRPYAQAEIVDVRSIFRKVIFTPGNQIRILEIPTHQTS